MDGHEPFLDRNFGGIYAVMALPGQVRANHYHCRASEWFTVVAGRALLRIRDVETDEQLDIQLDASDRKTVYVRAYVAHAFKNTENEETPMLLIAYADRPYEPEDTVPFNIL